MTRLAAISWLALAATLPVQALPDEESLKIYKEHPRIFLGPQRLRLLQRERDRRSLRWLQFETLMEGKAPMPERGFALALYYRVSGKQEFGRQAVAWALGPAADLRQLALIFDWCQDLLNPAQSKALAGKLQKGMAQTESDQKLPAVRSRMLAAVALADHLSQASTKEIEQLIRRWWEGRIVPALQSGRDMVPREDIYALFEILHVVRDNLNLDLRDAIPKYFKELPVYHLLSYYPASYPAAENEYRIPISRRTGEPDLRWAVLSRAAELSMVAYDVNAPESQILQGWLMHDNYLLRGTFGITYEFLWANPYQPGLSYYLLPLVYHDERFGRLFVRSNWEDSATWLGFFDGQLQMFQDGRVTILNPELTSGPIALPEAVVFFGNNAKKFKVLLQEDEQVFVLGLKPRRKFEIEVDDEEMTEGWTDPGGILTLTLPHKVEVGVRLRETRSD